MSLFRNLSQGRTKAVTGGLQIAGITLSLMNPLAWAETTPTSSITTAPKLIDQLTASYSGVFSGPSIGSPSNYQPDDQGHIIQEPFNRIVLRNSVNLGYKLNSDIVAGPVANFNYYPFPVFSNSAFEFADPALRISHAKLIHEGNFNMSGDVRALIPATQRTQNKGIITAIRAWQTSTYAVPNSRFQLGAYSFARAYFYKSGAKEDSMTLEAYLAPFVGYEFNNTVSMSLTYEMNALHRANESLLSWSPKDPTDLSLGLSVNVTPKISVNPYIEIFPGGKINLDATQVGAFISARLL